jgi:urease accessory protein UreH
MVAVDRRQTAAVGFHARLELAFGWRRGRTVLDYAYAEPPFRVGGCFGEGGRLHVILASLAPGVFGGDRLEARITVKAGARVRLTSQSALQAHPNPDGAPASLRASYEVEDGASLHCEWHPLIPFADARLDQSIDVRLAEGAFLYWSDAMMAGREGRGERWKFSALEHELKVWRSNSPEYIERFNLVPPERTLSHRWMAGTSCYFGTALVSGRRLEADAIERLHRSLNEIEGLRGAADLVDERLAVVRVTASAGPGFHLARKRINQALA